MPFVYGSYDTCLDYTLSEIEVTAGLGVCCLQLI